jgi:hypothetical protein
LTRADELTNEVLEAMKDLLKPLGFKKQGSTFRRETVDAIQLVNLQRSSSSSKDLPIVTVNFGFTLKVWREAWGAQRPVTSVWDSDWNQRLGRYLEMDKWWPLEDEASAKSAGTEIGDLLQHKALPEMESLSSEAGVRAALEAGMHPSQLKWELREFFVNPGSR